MSKLGRALKEITKEGLSNEKIYSSICKVLSVDESSRTCQLEPVNGDAERKGRIQASLSLAEGIFVKPVDGSFVQLSYINNVTGIITAYSEIESIEIKTSGGGVFSLNTKFSFGNADTDLLTVLTDLLTAIKNITVPTPSGTSGTPLNVADFVTVEQESKKLLE